MKQINQAISISEEKTDAAITVGSVAGLGMAVVSVFGLPPALQPYGVLLSFLLSFGVTRACRYIQHTDAAQEMVDNSAHDDCKDIALKIDKYEKIGTDSCEDGECESNDKIKIKNTSENDSSSKTMGSSKKESSCGEPAEIVIAGGGIVGLVLAMSLKKHLGLTPEIYDKCKTFATEAGAGLGMYPNGLRVIRDISPQLLQEIRDVGCPYKQRRWERHDGTEITTAEESVLSNGESELDSIGIRRSSLQKVLYKHALEMGIVTRFDMGLETAVERNDGLIEVKFSDGTTRITKLFFGADGALGNSRKAVAGTECPELKYTGVTCLMGLSETPRDGISFPSSDKDDFHAVFFPTRKNEQCFQFHMPIDEGNANQLNWGNLSDEVGKEECNKLAKQLRSEGWHDKYVQPLETAFKTVRVGFALLEPRLKKWCRGRMVLVGDAAHPPVPYVGQGAQQGMEDAGVVVSLLKLYCYQNGEFDPTNFEKAMTLYQDIRIKRSSQILDFSKSLGNLQAKRAGNTRKTRDADNTLKGDVLMYGTLPCMIPGATHDYKEDIKRATEEYHLPKVTEDAAMEALDYMFGVTTELVKIPKTADREESDPDKEDVNISVDSSLSSTSTRDDSDDFVSPARVKCLIDALDFGWQNSPESRSHIDSKKCKQGEPGLEECPDSPTVSSASGESSCFEESEGDFEAYDKSPEKIQRLIDWNVDMLQRLLQQVVAHRNSCSNQARESGVTPLNEELVKPVMGKMPLDEISEIIKLPDLDSSETFLEENADEIVLPKKVTKQLKNFVSNLAYLYRGNPFHNFEHACNVACSVSKLLARMTDSSGGCQQQPASSTAAAIHEHTYGIGTDPLTQFACMIAALIHDADHEGVPNTQLVKEHPYMSHIYQCKSVAEQHSVDLAWTMFMDKKYKNLRSIIYTNETEMLRFRRIIVNMVMATDICDKELKEFRNARWEKAFSEKVASRENFYRKATISIEHLIQASDVSHTMQPWPVYRQWNERLFQEMYKAYKDGRAEKDPSEFWYKGEIGFFNFYIIPLAKKLKDFDVFGDAIGDYLSNAIKNLEEWECQGEKIVELMVQNAKREYSTST